MMNQNQFGPSFKPFHVIIGQTVQLSALNFDQHCHLYDMCVISLSDF